MRRVVLVLAILLAGCVNRLAQRQAYLARFVGKPEAFLVQHMGVPSRSFEAGGVRYLAYTESRIDIIPGWTPHYLGPPYWGWYGGGFPPQVVNMVCEMTFAVRDGTVRSFSLRGNACG